MAINPMQKKARNSFLLGMLITLIICGVLAAAFYMLTILPDKKEAATKGEERDAYVLNQDVKAGDIITSDMFEKVTVYANTIPSNYIDGSKINELYLMDKDGNYIYTYLDEQSDGTKIAKMYIEQEDNETDTVYRYLTKTENGKKKEEKGKVIIEKDEKGKYYKTKLANQEKEYIEFTNIPVAAKISMNKNTLLTTNCVIPEEDSTTDDVREMEYNMITLPINVAVGDNVDVRITFPNGQDFIIMSKKEIKNIQGNTITFDVDETEILMMSGAIVESYIMTASNIYVAKYVDTEQVKATNTYTPTAEVVNLMKNDPNIVETASNKLSIKTDLRNNDMNSSSSQYSENALTNVEAGLKQQIENAQKAREQYLTGLTDQKTN